jgi:hypothetical protein
MDNAPSHPKDQTYSNVKVHFFPANTTSKLQPLDQGIIKCMKSHYRKQLLRKVITKVDQHLEASEIAKGINVYDACLWISQAQKCVTPDTVRKCFIKCGFTSDPEMEFTVAEFCATDPELSNMLSIATNSLHLDDPMTADEFINWDNNTPATEELSENWEEDLVQRHKTADTQDQTSDNEPEQEEPEPELSLKTHSDTLDSLSQCELYGMEKTLPAEYLECIRKAQEILQHHVIHVKCKAQQVTLDNFFCSK